MEGLEQILTRLDIKTEGDRSKARAAIQQTAEYERMAPKVYLTGDEEKVFDAYVAGQLPDDDLPCFSSSSSSSSSSSTSSASGYEFKNVDILKMVNAIDQRLCGKLSHVEKEQILESVRRDDQYMPKDPMTVPEVSTRPEFGFINETWQKPILSDQNVEMVFMYLASMSHCKIDTTKEDIDAIIGQLELFGMTVTIVVERSDRMQYRAFFTADIQRMSEQTENEIAMKRAHDMYMARSQSKTIRNASKEIEEGSMRNMRYKERHRMQQILNDPVMKQKFHTERANLNKRARPHINDFPATERTNPKYYGPEPKTLLDALKIDDYDETADPRMDEMHNYMFGGYTEEMREDLHNVYKMIDMNMSSSIPTPSTALTAFIEQYLCIDIVISPGINTGAADVKIHRKLFFMFSLTSQRGDVDDIFPESLSQNTSAASSSS